MGDTEGTESKGGKLEDIVVDEDEINRELLYDILSDYVRIGNQSGQILTQSPFDGLTAKQQIAVLLLAQQASVEVGKADTEWLGPSEIHEISGIKDGTVRPKVRELFEDGVAENDDGSYRIPAHRFQRAADLINRGNDDES